MNAIYSHDERGQRDDLHRPSAINPGDYKYLKVGEARAERKAGQKVGGPAGTCHHCGKGIVWEVYYQHLPTGNIVTFGYICAGILDMTDNRIDHEMTLLKRRAENERRAERFANEKAERYAEFVANHSDMWQFIQDHADENGWLNRIKWGVETYGSPLYWQIEKVQRYIDGYNKMIANKLAEAKQLENAPNLVEGRQTITGTIISHKFVDTGNYGIQHKMQVKFDDGNRVYGTMPKSIEDAIQDDPVGRRVEFVATVEPKEDHFGFFSRPAKGKVV